jgi:hypothetical protein
MPVDAPGYGLSRPSMSNLACKRGCRLNSTAGPRSINRLESGRQTPRLTHPDKTRYTNARFLIRPPLASWTCSTTKNAAGSFDFTSASTRVISNRVTTQNNTCRSLSV